MSKKPVVARAGMAPRRPAAAAACPNRTQRRPGMNPKHRILVVEDKQHERLAIARLLWQEDYEVLLAENPQQASGFLDDEVDLVISDLRMGEHSGIDLLRLWKK